MKQHSLAAKARWKKVNKKDRLLYVKKMNEARIKIMAQRKKDAEAYRQLKIQEFNLT